MASHITSRPYNDYSGVATKVELISPPPAIAPLTLRKICPSATYLRVPPQVDPVFRYELTKPNTF